ncbi:hypothetical protein HYX17_05490 [Candidatus Woesearchaeota archaeon]|nr:hypothetical protein [Candidatus Woesearchaeota archaeon]
MAQDIVQKKEFKYNVCILDNEYIYMTTICPICGITELEHFIPMYDEEYMDALEKSCLECIHIIEEYEKSINEIYNE